MLVALRPVPGPACGLPRWPLADGPWLCSCSSSTVSASNGTVLAFFAIDASPARALPSRAMAASRLPTGTPSVEPCAVDPQPLDVAVVPERVVGLEGAFTLARLPRRCRGSSLVTRQTSQSLSDSCGATRARAEQEGADARDRRATARSVALLSRASVIGSMARSCARASGRSIESGRLSS